MPVRPLTGWRDDRGLGGSSGRHVFNAVIMIRWASLVIALAGYLRNLSVRQMEYGHFLPMLAFASVYTLATSVWAGRIYEWHKRSDLFSVIDYAVTLIAFSTTGTVWNPFLMFGACSFLFSGLRGDFRRGVVAGNIVALLLLISLPIKAVSLDELIATDSLVLLSVYVLQFIGFSAAWATAMRLLARLDEAYADVDANRGELERTKEELDQRRRQLLALHRIRHAILLKADAGEIVGIVENALEENGFVRPRTWLLRNDELRAFPEDGSAPIDLFGTHPLAVAAHDRETVMTECDAAAPTEDDLPPACVAAPILSPEDVLGVVVVGNGADSPMSAERVEMLEQYADQVALAFAHLDAYDHASDLAVAAERDRVTAEIHQGVVAKLYEARSLAESVSDVPPDVASKLGMLKDTILGSLQDLRFVVLGWRSLEWDSTPVDLVQRYVREFSTLSGIRVLLDTSGAESCLSGPQSRGMLRIVQEALSNAWRHAGATEATVRLEFMPDGASVAVVDNGGGFDPGNARGVGGGLRSIEDIAARAGGRVEIMSAPGQGSSVIAWLPC